MSKKVYVNVVEYGVFNYPHPDMAHDEKGWGGWHFMRIEYHDVDEPYAFLEHNIWTPPGMNSAVLEDFMNEYLERGENDDESIPRLPISTQEIEVTFKLKGENDE